MKFLTKNQVVTQLKTLANNHLQIRGFGYGDRWELETAMTQTDSTTNGLAQPQKQPFMWVTPIIARVSDGSLFYDFEVIVGDLVKKDESNELEVESDTLLICLDVLSKLEDETYDWSLSKQSNLQPFTEKWDSEFTGHIMNISLEFMFNYDYCQIPFPQPDADILAFLTATGIEDETQIFAITYLVTQLKQNGLWDKMHVIYPFVGGTAYKHSFNLKNPNQYKITWSPSGVTHDTNGITGDGISGYGNSNYVVPPENQNNLHISLFHRNNYNNTGTVMGIVQETSSCTIILSSGNIYIGRINQVTGGEVSNSYTTSSNAFYVSTRKDNLNVLNFKDNYNFYSEVRASVHPPTLPLYILCRNLSGTADYFSPSNLRLISIGEGLTNDEVRNLTQIAQKYQGYLNRAH